MPRVRPTLHSGAVPSGLPCNDYWDCVKVIQGLYAYCPQGTSSAWQAQGKGWSLTVRHPG